MAIRVLCCSNTDNQKLISLLYSTAGITVEAATDGHAALNILGNTNVDAVFADFPLRDWTPAELIEEIQRINPLASVVIRDPRSTLSDAVRLTRLGAYQCLGRDVSPSEIEEVVASAAQHYRDRRTALYGNSETTEPWKSLLVGESRAMANVHQVIRLIGARRSTVMISGETGTGKEMVARSIHMASPRSHLPMVAVNCSALPENLLEAELFGHVKGAFTGAVGNRVGRFEQAHRGTIFLDEVGDMPLDLQAKLLRVLQEKEFQRLGSSETIKVDVRVLAASNVDLVERIRDGRFREDLYYRLNVVPLALPPLRDRRRDIPLLVEHFIQKICRAENLPPRQVSPETLTRLARYEWPGNVRQLENAVEMAVALSGDRITLYPGDFPLPSNLATKPMTSTSPVISVPDDGLDFEETIGRLERALLEQAMNKTGGNKKQAADMLGLKRTTFTAKLRTLSSSAVACAAN